MMHAKDIRFTHRGHEVECLLSGDWVMSMDTHTHYLNGVNLAESGAEAVRLICTQR